MTQLAGLPPDAFGKYDEAPDAAFYRSPRFVTHIDDKAIAAVSQLYRSKIPPGSAVLDLMSSWVSHLPENVAYGEVTGLGMNAAELDANRRLTRRIVQDLNREPRLSLPDASFDAITVCVSVQYLQHPVHVFRDVRRVLRPGGQVLVTFSNRCFPTKAVAIWTALDGEERKQLVTLYLQEAGFDVVEAFDPVPEGGRSDPLHAVVASSGRTSEPDGADA